MALETIITEIKNLLETVSGIGTVHNRERRSSSTQDFISQFLDTNNKVNGWTITRNESREEFEAQDSVNITTHSIIIRGYYSLDDAAASEATFRQLVEDIRTKLRENNDLNGSCWKSSPPENPVNRQVKYGGYLCHYAEITLDADEYIQY